MSEDVFDMRMEVNGTQRTLRVPARLTLADALRHSLDLTGTHIGCEHGICGACTVLVDGDPCRSCLLFAVQADGCKIETVEGLERDGRLNQLQEAFSRHHALQCGFCTPGFLMLATALIREDPNPSPEAIREVLSSNLCRCTGYQGIFEAISDVVAGGASS